MRPQAVPIIIPSEAHDFFFMAKETDQGPNSNIRSETAALEEMIRGNHEEVNDLVRVNDSIKKSFYIPLKK